MATFSFFEAFERFLVIPELMVGPSNVGPDPYAEFICTIYIIWVRLGDGLKKGKGRHWQDHFNKIYLGLVMAQTGQTKEGKAELDAGLEALGAWLSSFAGRGSTGQYWDPGWKLQKAIANTRNLLQGDKINWDKVNKAVRWLGVNFEEETSAPRVHID